jgi:hypothetical protein
LARLGEGVGELAAGGGEHLTLFEERTTENRVEAVRSRERAAPRELGTVHVGLDSRRDERLRELVRVRPDPGVAERFDQREGSEAAFTTLV